jgi:hypothetical protein
MIVELARRVSSCGWAALCERPRAGFARLSGWQPVGNWVASGANFPASLLPVGFTPKRAEESRRAVCAEKWPEAQAERVAGVHVFSSQEGRNHPPRLGSFFCRAGRRGGIQITEVAQKLLSSPSFSARSPSASMPPMRSATLVGHDGGLELASSGVFASA